MPGEVVDIVMMAAFVLLMVFMVLWCGPMLTLHTRARSAGVPVALVELLGMHLRRVNAGVVIGARIEAARAGIRLTLNELEAHFLAGGRVPEAVAALIGARQAGLDVAWDTVAANDLAGRDMLDAAKPDRQPRSDEHGCGDWTSLAP